MTSLVEIKDEFWGDRSFTMRDPNGYVLVFAKVVDAQTKSSYDKQ